MKSIGLYPGVRTDRAGSAVVSLAGGGRAGRDRPGRGAGPGAVAGARAVAAAEHAARPGQDPGRPGVVAGSRRDCLADVAVLRDQRPGVFGPVASDPTVSRLVDTLAADAAKALAAVNAARAVTRAKVWVLAGEHAPNHAASVDDPTIVDLDATLLTAHSEKEQAAPTFKRGFGFHPLLAFVDHGVAGTGELLSFLLRRGNAGSNTAADHITVARALSRNCRAIGQAEGRAGPCWCAPTAPAAPTRSWPG